MSNRFIPHLLITTFVAGASAVALAQTNKSLSDLEGLERSGDRKNSPSQVVILNNSPSSRQDQLQNQEFDSEFETKQDSYQNTRNRSKSNVVARTGWGNGDTVNLMRDIRVNKESQNEAALIEKLEESRLEDERSRLKRLFKIREYNRRRHQEMGDDSWDDGYHGQHQQQYQHQNHQEPVKVVKVNHVKPDAPKHDTVESNNYSHSSWADTVKGFYFKGQLGLGEYSAAENATGISSWGISLGKNVNRRLYYEVGVFRTSYEVNDPRGNTEFDFYGNAYTLGSNLRDLEQYNFNSLLGYKLIKTSDFSVSLRGGLSYVRRVSDATTLNNFAKFRSNAVDALFGVSSDVRLGNSFYATGSFDYFTNFLNNISSSDQDIVQRVEKSDYYVLGVGLKYEF